MDFVNGLAQVVVALVLLLNAVYSGWELYHKFATKRRELRAARERVAAPAPTDDTPERDAET